MAEPAIARRRSEVAPETTVVRITLLQKGVAALDGTPRRGVKRIVAHCYRLRRRGLLASSR
jgi:hypothetical protein